MAKDTTLPRAGQYLIYLILLAAVFFRFHALPNVPPGLTHDEGSVGFFVRQVAAGKPFQIDAPYGYANEPFSQYSGAIVVRLLGPSDWALRAHQAFWGVALVLTTYLWGRAAFGKNVGLGASALTAVSFWPQMTSRLALNSSPAPALLAGAVWLMWIALFKERLRFRALAWIGFALCIAASLYTYEASRGAWLALPAFVVFLAVFGQRRRLPQFAAAMAGGTALALPHLLKPAAWGRTSTLSGPLQSAAAGDFWPLLRNAVEALDTLTIKGDPFIVYNIPDKPVFGPITGLLFVAGLLICLWCWRRAAYGFSLLWFAAGFAPAMAAGAFAMMLHAITAQAVVFTMPALAISELAQHIPRQFRRYVWRGLALIISFTALVTFRDYFGVWANSPDTRAAYFSNFRAIALYLRAAPCCSSVTLSSRFPDLPHDPFNADLLVRRGDLDLRWFDAREAVVFPQSQQSLLILPSNTPPDALIASHLPLADAVRHGVRESDIDPYFDSVIWNPQHTLNEWLADGSLTALSPPANFGGALELIAFGLGSPAARPGESVVSLTFWRILNPAALGARAPINYSPEAQIFLHVLDSDGSVVAGSDRLHAPAWNWRAGDTFAQIHRAELPADIPPGDYALEVGIYTLPDLARLPRLDAAADLPDRTRIGTIRVNQP